MTYQLRKNSDESDVIRIFMDEEDVPVLTGEALRRFREVTQYRGEVDLGNNNKAVVEKKPKVQAKAKSAAPLVPEEACEAKTKSRLAGAEADVEMTPSQENLSPEYQNARRELRPWVQRLPSRQRQCLVHLLSQLTHHRLVKMRLWRCSRVELKSGMAGMAVSPTQRLAPWLGTQQEDLAEGAATFV